MSLTVGLYADLKHERYELMDHRVTGFFLSKFGSNMDKPKCRVKHVQLKVKVFKLHF